VDGRGAEKSLLQGERTLSRLLKSETPEKRETKAMSPEEFESGTLFFYDEREKRCRLD